MKAKALNKPSPVNLAQHTYWNLGGHNSGDILSNEVQIFGSHITVVDSHLIPTGKFASVKGTPYDFLKPNDAPIRGGVLVVRRQWVEAQKPAMDSEEAKEGGGVARWRVGAAKTNRSGLEGAMLGGAVEVSSGKDNIERRSDVMAQLGSGGGAEEHSWCGNTVGDIGNTPKQKEKSEKNQRKGKRKKEEEWREESSLHPQNSRKKQRRVSQRRWKLIL
jgi:hypothetical protein